MALQNYNNNRPVFRGWERAVYKTEKGGRVLSNLKYTNKTWAMREFPKIEERAKIIIRDGIEHVYDMGCSCGIDTMCLAIGMIEEGGYDALRKCGPIMAMDIDGGAIYQANSGRVFLEPREVSDIDVYTNGKLLNYFSQNYTPDMLRAGYWYPNPIIKSNIIFKTGDIREKYVDINPEKSFAQTRNIWPYFELDDREILARNLYRHLDKTSDVVIGKFDNQDPFYHVKTEDILRQAGFVQHADSEYVFKK